MSLRKEIDEWTATQAVYDLRNLGIDLFDMTDYLDTVWAWKHNASMYDAMYLTLAQITDTKLLTFDRRLATAAPHLTLEPNYASDDAPYFK